MLNSRRCLVRKLPLLIRQTLMKALELLIGSNWVSLHVRNVCLFELSQTEKVVMLSHLLRFFRHVSWFDLSQRNFSVSAIVSMKLICLFNIASNLLLLFFSSFKSFVGINDTQQLFVPDDCSAQCLVSIFKTQI